MSGGGSEMMMMMMMMMMMLVAFSVVGGGGYWYYITYVKEPDNCVAVAWTECKQYTKAQYTTCRDASKTRCMAKGGTWSKTTTTDTPPGAATGPPLKLPAKDKAVYIFNRNCSSLATGPRWSLLTLSKDPATKTAVGNWYEKISQAQWKLIPSSTHYYIQNVSTKTYLGYVDGAETVTVNAVTNHAATEDEKGIIYWDVVYNGTDRTFTIQHVKTKRYLSLYADPDPNSVNHGCNKSRLYMENPDNPAHSRWVPTPDFNVARASNA